MQEINASKPNIPELNEISEKEPEKFLQAAKSKFSKQIEKYKDDIRHEKTEILDINKYIGGLGI